MWCRLITHGAPLQYCSAGMAPARIRRSTVMGLRPSSLAASGSVTSPRAAHSPPGGHRAPRGRLALARLGPCALLVARDAVRVAEAAHARLRPPVQPARPLARPVEHA